MVQCPNCGYNNADNSSFCVSCGRSLPRQQQAQQPVRTVGGNTAPKGGGKLVIGIILAGIGIFFTFFGGFWMISIPSLILAAYIASQSSEGLGRDLIPRLALGFIAITIGYMNIIPENKFISVVLLAAASIGIILSLPAETIKKDAQGNVLERSFSGVKYARALQVIVYSFGLIGTGLWTYFMVGLTPVIITVGAVAASIVWKQPIEPGWKMAGTIVCFGPAIFFGVQFIFVQLSTSWGGFVGQIQHTVSEGLGSSSSGTMFDMILNPKLAVQAQLKPATTREVTETNVNPSVAFTVTAESIPTSGCYDSSSFQIIGRVRNSGTEFIKDLKLWMDEDIGDELDLTTTCNDIIDPVCTTPGWPVSSLPIGVSSSKNCVIENVVAPAPLLTQPDVSPTKTCFIDVFAETGYHSISRLPVEFIDSEYARQKAEQKQLTFSSKPATTSVGPVEFSIGGIEQPVIVSDSKPVMITTISESGTGVVSDYLSAYLYIPNALLKDGQCQSPSDDWVCSSSLNCDSLSQPAKGYCNNYMEYVSGSIGGYTQFGYDNSDELLSSSYSICFYTGDLSVSNLIITGSCTLNVNSGSIFESDVNALRKTLIIRGDVLYKYVVNGEASITVQDCNI